MCGDTLFHAWDLARATGQDDTTLDPALCDDVLELLTPMDAGLRGAGRFAPKVDAPCDADPQTRLLSFGGRER